MSGTAVFIDGGYVNQVIWHTEVSRIDYDKLVNWVVGRERLLRAYYYTAPPYLSEEPTPEEQQHYEAELRFYEELENGHHFTVRQGKLAKRGTDGQGHPKYEQKRVDLLLGLDVASLASKGRIDTAVLITGDSDFIPAVQLAKQEGVVVRLVHGPHGTYHPELWQEADERLEMTREILAKLKYEG